LTHSLRWSESRAERVRSLVLEKVAGLLRCPLERREEATHEAFSKLRPHVEAELEALETMEGLRELTEEELDRRRVFALLVSVVRQEGAAKRPARERILEVLRLKAATNSEIQRRTGISEGTIRNNLSGLIHSEEVLGDGGRPKTYQLVTSSGSRKASRG
jgi:predicted HTH transcriptional regulator